MDNKQEASNSQEMNEARKPKKSLKERCKEMGAIPLSQFEKEVSDAINEGYRNHGKYLSKGQR